MTLPRFTHVMPSNVKEALGLLREKGEKARVIAGGSDLIVQMKHRTITPEYVIDLKGLKELKGITEDSGKGLKIGALCTLEEVSQSQEVKKRFPILAQAAGKVASVQIRNVATLGGNICLNTRCWYFNQSAQWRKAIARCYKMGGEECLVIKNSDRCNAVFLADTVPALIALGARLRIAKKGSKGRTLPVEEFYNATGHPPNLLAPEEILTEIEVPETAPNTYTVFFKDAPREVVDFALVNMAMSISLREKGGPCKEARIVVGGVTSHPVRARKAEKLLKGEKIEKRLIEEVADAVIKECAPISPIWRAPVERRQTIRSLVKKGLQGAVV